MFAITIRWLFIVMICTSLVATTGCSNHSHRDHDRDSDHHEKYEDRDHDDDDKHYKKRRQRR